jgi:holo-[acyl-carrier protein] synthase
MILGVGIDITETSRVKEKISRDMGFKEKVFSKTEIDYCESNPTGKYQHYAARFAAKEAFLKASGKGLQLSHELHEIMIVTNDVGHHTIQISDAIKEALGIKSLKIHVSLSHLELTACAVVVLETLN